MVSIDFLPMHLVILKEESVNITSSKTMVHSAIAFNLFK
ncbi:hypothetical protein DJ66_0144 [Candidatus Liberibacter solanacearum]|uniref:Uncharacterized protein n=1 Tax=Candidatus Liberibacter solanacearum TaxID=556287 RepID=A0A0F4VM27_9HYPH|nr:hypothetical protein DJ66_0144 [Candidatus Liberibacter solanacearum]